VHEYVANFALWLAAATTVAAIASRIIFGLQQQIRHARRIGAYVLEDKIGEGGMGVVFRAKHALLRRETAIKMLLPGRMAPTALARFEREVQQLARLNHPNTIAIYDYGRTPDGVFYYAMEYIDGLDLEELVEAIGPLPPGRALHLLVQICESLAEAHELGLVHRDIKPANVLVGQRGGIPDSVKVLDFGLVKDIGNTDAVTLTEAERFVGTPLYASPEAIRSTESVTFATDLYSVGAIGYYLLTGTHLVQRETFIDVCAQHLYGTPEPPSLRLGKPLPPMLEALLLQALAKAPEQRPTSAKEFACRLRACADVPPWSEESARLWWAEAGAVLVRKKMQLQAGNGPDSN
jgi:serine/threonine-protein kinase